MIEGIIIGVLFLFTFIVGFNTGLKVNKGEKIEIPNPVVKVNEVMQDTKEAIAEQKQNALIMEGISNIFNYDGTPQKGAR